MNILIVQNNEVRPTYGGISRISYSLSKMFGDASNEVYFLASNRLSDEECMNHQLFLPSSNVGDLCNVRFVEDVINRYGINFIINQACYNVTLTSLIRSVIRNNSNVKLVTCFHNSVLTPVKNFAYTKEYYLKKKKLYFIFKVLKLSFVREVLTNFYAFKKRKLYRAIVDKSDVSIVLSEGQKRELLLVVGSNYQNQIYVVPNTVGIISELDIANKENIILWVGTFDMEIKRPDLMLRIWNEIYKENPTWKLVMLGDGIDFNEAKNLTSILGVKNVLFEGRVNPYDYYKKAKIICITSTHESFSLVTVEGMSYGVVPILFDSFYSASEIVTDGKDGFLIPPFEISVFAQKLNRLMKQVDLVEKYGVASNEASKRYSFENIYGYWKNLFA